MPGYSFQWSVVTDHWHVLLWAAWTNLWAATVGFVLACAIGIFVALLRLGRSQVLKGVAFGFIQVARGVPPYVFLLWVHFGLPGLLGVYFLPMQSVIIVLAVTGSGYAAEVFRSGLLAIDSGQVEAARSLGLRRVRVYTDVVLPQAVRIIIPPLGNIFIGVLKTATLMGVIAVPDLLHIAQGINVTYFVPFEAFTAVLIIFVSMVFAVSLLVLGIERALEHP